MHECEASLTFCASLRLHLAPSSSIGTAETSLPALPTAPQAPIDLLSTLLGAQLAYTGTERDAVILHHELTTTSPSEETELFTSTLVQVSLASSTLGRSETDSLPAVRYP